MRFFSLKSLSDLTLGSRVSSTLGTPVTAEIAFTAPFDFAQMMSRLEVPPATTSTLPASRASALAPPLSSEFQVILRSAWPVRAANCSAILACCMTSIGKNRMPGWMAMRSSLACCARAPVAIPSANTSAVAAAASFLMDVSLPSQSDPGSAPGIYA